MLVWSVFRPLAVAAALLGMTTSVSCQRANSAKQGTSFSPSVKPESVDTKDLDSLPRLPETEPPAGLPIVLWGKRDHFPVIRNPEYLTAKQGDRAMAPDEPVLGLVIGDEARAYSTNQLNKHEMVIDTIEGKP